MTTAVPVRVRTDVFPATLVVSPPDSPRLASTRRYPTADDGSGHRLLDRVRVILADSNVYVFRDSSAGPELVFAEAYVGYEGPTPAHERLIGEPANEENLVTTQSGKTLAFRHAGGCGCGSRLKTFDPFKVIAAQSQARAHSDA